MNIHFKNPPEGLSVELIERVEKKIKKLNRFIPERNYEAQVFVEVRKVSSSQSSDKMWQTSIHFELSGQTFDAEETGSNAEKSTDLAISELGSEMRKARTKDISISKREGGVLKRLMRGFRE